jgi:hypothetical protein
MNDRPNPALAGELRYALDVMEERSHLGLDDEVASNLKGILLRRIADAEDSLKREPANRIQAHDSEFCE